MNDQMLSLRDTDLQRSGITGHCRDEVAAADGTTFTFLGLYI
jgi:hypothetical protein